MTTCTYDDACLKGCGICERCGLSLHFTTGGDRIVTCGCGLSDWRPPRTDHR